MSNYDLGFEINEKVERVGDFTVTIQEKPNTKKVGCLVTFHDIGLNHTSFKDFFKNQYNLQFYDRFTIYHIDAPGQQKNADKFSNEYQFQTLSKIAEVLGTVLDHYELKDVIGFGVGAGANILLHAASIYPKVFLGLVLSDPAGKTSGFKEWGENKMAAWQLETKGFSSSSDKYLIWHLFGPKGTKNANMEMVDNYIKQITVNQNPHNLAQYVRAYMNRPDVIAETQGKIQCQVLIATSAYSPYKEEGVKLHAALDKKKSTILESMNTINIFFEDPEKLGEGMLLLMQGCGLAPNLRTRTASRGGPVHRTASMCED